MSPVAITLALLLFVIVMFVWEKIPLAVTSIIALLVLVLTGVLSPKDAFGGFVDNNLILFVAMFVIGGCFFETGMANRVGGIVTKFAHTERELIVAVMLVTGIMSGFLSNTGTAAILIPIVIGTASKSGFSRSRLLLIIHGISHVLRFFRQETIPDTGKEGRTDQKNRKTDKAIFKETDFNTYILKRGFS